MLKSIILGGESTNIIKLSICIYRADIHFRLLKHTHTHTEQVKETFSPPVESMKKTAFQKLSE